MKRKVSLLMVLVFLFTVMIPSNIFAENDQGLEKAIKTAKEKIEVPAQLTQFNYDMGTENSKKIWNLNWLSKDGNDGNLNIRIDERGTVLNYNYYKPGSSNPQSKLPKVSRQEAVNKAEAFINRVNPGLTSQLRLMPGYNNTIQGDSYYFNYIRVVNGIPFYSNSVNVGVNRETGLVQNYYYNWTDNLVFPASDKVIGLEKAQSAYKEKLGLRLAYNSTLEDEKLKIFTVYTPKSANGQIDALTGDKIQMSSNYYPYAYADGAMKETSMMLRGYGTAASPVALTPEEVNSIEKASKLLSIEEVEKIARSYKTVELTSEFKLTGSNLTRDWMSREDYNWFLNFSKDSGNKGDEPNYISVRVNAKTGEVTNFYYSVMYKSADKSKYGEADAKAAVEKFLKDNTREKFNTTELDNDNNYYYGPMGSDNAPRQYNFRYVRKVNGTVFTGNYLSATYDTVLGKIVNYESSWYNTEFPPVEKVISVDNAYTRLFADIGLELQYMPKYPETVPGKIVPQPENIVPEVKLVYALKPGKPQLLDAFTGTVLDGNGKPYKEVKPASYTDISGSFAEKQITALAEYGIALEGTEFKPNESILQKDFLRLLVKTLNYYESDPLSADAKGIEMMYNYLVREGIIKNNEKAPDSAVTREDAVKLIIRAMKLDKAADIKGIYKSSFKDASKINPDLYGYVTIAAGLGIVNGEKGYFNPKAQLTRAEAAVIIYNYLQK